MNMKRTTLAAAVLAACALGVSGQAAAEAYVGSSLGISNLNIVFSPLPTPSSISYSFFVSNSATLNGGLDANSDGCSGTATSTTCNTTTPVLAPGAVNGTGSNPLRTDNNYALFGPNATDTYSNSNSAIFTAELLGMGSSSASAVSEAQLAGDGSGQANTLVQSNTTLTLSFELPTTGSIALNFDAISKIEAALNTPNLLFATGQASTTGIFKLTDAAGNTVSEIQPNQLNQQLNLPGNGNDIQYNLASTPLGFSVSDLAAGQYFMNLNMGTGVSVTQQTIPEPATPALMALGLVGIGATLRRRKTLRQRKQG